MILWTEISVHSSQRLDLCRLAIIIQLNDTRVFDEPARCFLSQKMPHFPKNCQKQVGLWGEWWGVSWRGERNLPAKPLRYGKIKKISGVNSSALLAAPLRLCLRVSARQGVCALPRPRKTHNLEVIYAARMKYEASITPRTSCAPHLVPNFSA